MGPGFAAQASAIGKADGILNLPIAEYPGNISLHSKEEVRKNVEEVVFDQVVEALTKIAVETEAAVVEPEPREVVFKGTFEEVNEHFYQQQWSDGLPIVPPTKEKVEEFLKYTDRDPDEVLGILRPRNAKATVWQVTVNGVMAGCRPEYMPVLMAMVEVMADPHFGLQHAGSTPGWQAVTILNGPIIKQLGFNYGTALLRPGNRANYSVGRFFRLFMRNIPGFLPGLTDMGTWGRNFLPVLAENEDALKRLGWQPLSVMRGFKPDDNVITIMSARARPYDPSTLGDTAEEHLNHMARNLVAMITEPSRLLWGEHSHLLGLSPCIAEIIARDGYSKKDVQQYLWEQARIPARLIDEDFIRRKEPTLCACVEEGRLPKLFCESDDTERILPLWVSPDELLVVVAGDPYRNRNMILGVMLYRD